jgi:hypothetical protein
VCSVMTSVKDNPSLGDDTMEIDPGMLSFYKELRGTNYANSFAHPAQMA